MANTSRYIHRETALFGIGWHQKEHLNAIQRPLFIFGQTGTGLELVTKNPWVRHVEDYLVGRSP